MVAESKHGTACEGLTIEQDAAIAASAIEAHDLPHAAIHVASALGVDPLRPELRRLFETWYAAADDPLRLLPIPPGTSYSICLMHAEVLARRGKRDEALDLLFRAAAARLDIPIVAWGRDWLVNDAVAPSLDPAKFESGIGAFASALGRSGGSAHPSTVKAGLAIVERLRAAHPAHTGLAYWHVAVLRGLARIPEALTLSREFYAVNPCWRSALAVGMVLRRTDDFDGAVAMFQRALTHDPTDLGCRLDLGDMLCDAGRVDEGIAYYDEVLALAPGHAWALPSALFFRALRDRDAGAAEQLRLMTFNTPDNRRAAALAERLPADLRAAPERARKSTGKAAKSARKTRPTKGTSRG